MGANTEKEHLLPLPSDSLETFESLSPMAELKTEVVDPSDLLQPQQCSSPVSSFPSSQFIEINCNSSGKVRRFSAGTEAGFALQLINQKLVPEVPSASYIEAYKEGEEPIYFGPNSVLIDYGDGWKLQTVVNECLEKAKDMEQHEELPSVIEQARDNAEILANSQLQLVDPLQEVEKPITSEPVSDIESQSEKLDLTDVFTTNEVFHSRDQLVKWTRDVGKSVGTVVIIMKSDMGTTGRTPRIVFGCERFGKYRMGRSRALKKLPVRRTGTKKCECPFQLKGVKLPKDDQWIVKVECGVHNHPLSPCSEGHSYGGKLNNEERAFVLELSEKGVKPREVLRLLKERDQHNATTMGSIYNIRKRLKDIRKSSELIEAAPIEVSELVCVQPNELVCVQPNELVEAVPYGVCVQPDELMEAVANEVGVKSHDLMEAVANEVGVKSHDLMEAVANEVSVT